MRTKKQTARSRVAVTLCEGCGANHAAVILQNGKETTRLCEPCAREQIYEFVTENDRIAFSCTDDPLTITVGGT